MSFHARVTGFEDNGSINLALGFSLTLIDNRWAYDVDDRLLLTVEDSSREAAMSLLPAPQQSILFIRDDLSNET